MPQSKNLEKRVQIEGRSVRFTNFVDGESFAFEAEAAGLLADASIEQRAVYLQHCGREFYLMQMRTADGRPAMQAAAYVGRPRSYRLASFALMTSPNLHTAINPEEEEIGIEALRRFSADVPGVMSLRLQPKRFDPEALTRFQERAHRLRFRPSAPLGATRTLILNIAPTPEEQFKAFSKSTKAKLRHHGRNAVDIRAIGEEKYIPFLRAASEASRKRTGAGPDSYDYETLFSLIKSDPAAACVLGLFLRARPERPMAYVIGIKNGETCEFSSAGAIQDPELRKVPFNYFLVWELINWARSVGCRRFDMGGITPGDPKDPLYGISRFKRSITNHELETGREMVHVLSPFRLRLYRILKLLRDWILALGLSPTRT